jgi:G8 domain
VVSFSIVAWYKLGLRQWLDSLFRKHGNRFPDHGGLTMRKHSLLCLSLLFPACLVLGGHAVVKAQQRTSSTASAKRWSDAATWPDKKVPAKDDVVTIEKSMNVVLDVSPPPLHGLRINGN